MLNRQQTIAHIVLEHSECAPVFQRHRIDFCCRGGMSVEAAAKDKGLEPDQLLGELSRAISERRGERTEDLRNLTTQQLVDRIVSKHHDYLRQALPFVQALAAKVSRVHGDHNPKLRDLRVAVDELVAELLPHLDWEEQELLPSLTASEADTSRVVGDLAAMEAEHLGVADLLERIRASSEDFTCPDWACTSYRTLFSELKQLESDTFAHVHLENHVLRPRFASC